MRLLAAGLALVPLVAPALQAQKPSTVKADVQAFVRSYADAANRGDAAAYAAMYKESADLIVINDGEVKRGWSSIRDEANQILGTEGSYKISAGIVDVLPLGSTRAVASFPFVLTVQTQAGLAQLKGASTLVLEKTGTKWLIVHDHTSLQQPPATQTE
ncbi:MAG: YybH family protein [Gemmatimonadales bacterium]